MLACVAAGPAHERASVVRLTLYIQQEVYSVCDAGYFLCTIDFRTFDYVRFANVLGEFDYVQLQNPIEVNRTIAVRLGSITKRSIDCAQGRISSFSLAALVYNRLSWPWKDKFFFHTI